LDIKEGSSFASREEVGGELRGESMVEFSGFGLDGEEKLKIFLILFNDIPWLSRLRISLTTLDTAVVRASDTRNPTNTAFGVGLKNEKDEILIELMENDHFVHRILVCVYGVWLVYLLFYHRVINLL
jgi:hypothetical protein